MLANPDFVQGPVLAQRIRFNNSPLFQPGQPNMAQLVTPATRMRRTAVAALVATALSALAVCAVA
ncbi:MAG: hypothetical protein V4793_12250, partial [Paraburkholderia tropica]